ncbi:MAG: hypothetical protein EHM45_17460 [Desulfobacteraceae bacterium]|nr:MAG: hypothetical protein EHM45_17460 [Desulfobacteraceae bacterium]
MKKLFTTDLQSYGLVPAARWNSCSGPLELLFRPAGTSVPVSLELLFRLAGIHVLLILDFQDQ